MVGEAVEECPGEVYRAKNLGPLVEGLVRGSQDRAEFIALAEDLEEQLDSGLGQMYIPPPSHHPLLTLTLRRRLGAVQF